jgi:hypothetical protein
MSPAPSVRPLASAWALPSTARDAAPGSPSPSPPLALQRGSPTLPSAVPALLDRLLRGELVAHAGRLLRRRWHHCQHHPRSPGVATELTRSGQAQPGRERAPCLGCCGCRARRGTARSSQGTPPPLSTDGGRGPQRTNNARTSARHGNGRLLGDAAGGRAIPLAIRLPGCSDAPTSAGATSALAGSPSEATEMFWVKRDLDT